MGWWIWACEARDRCNGPVLKIPPFHKIWCFRTGWFKSLPSKNVPARSLIRWGADFVIASKCKPLSISVYIKTSGCKLGRLTSQIHNHLWFSCNSWRVYHPRGEHLQPAQVNPAWISLNCPCFLNYPAVMYKESGERCCRALTSASKVQVLSENTWFKIQCVDFSYSTHLIKQWLYILLILTRILSECCIPKPMK